MVGVVDYGMGNLHSIQKAFHRLQIETTVVQTPAEILAVEKLVIPGVGHFRNGMDRLRELGFIEPLNQRALIEKKPILGICLGAQLFTNHSEEGDTRGLGWVPGRTLRFNFDAGVATRLKVPHMGWNQVTPKANESIFRDINQEQLFYFVHSYYIRCEREEHVAAKSTFGQQFDAAIRNQNIIGVQFHPEKSHKAGLQLLKNFAAA